MMSLRWSLGKWWVHVLQRFRTYGAGDGSPAKCLASWTAPAERQRRRRFRTAWRIRTSERPPQSGVALRLPPQSKTPSQLLTSLPTVTLPCPIAPSSRRANRKSARPAVAGTSPPKIIRPPAESGAKATAVQTLTRLPDVLEPREASGLRRVHRRFSRSAGL